jgi:protein SCO1/2
MDHSAGSYAFDPEGRLRLYIKHCAQGPETLAHDLERVVEVG